MPDKARVDVIGTKAFLNALDRQATIRVRVSEEMAARFHRAVVQDGLSEQELLYWFMNSYISGQYVSAKHVLSK